jgi:hypothetical protein
VDAIVMIPNLQSLLAGIRAHTFVRPGYYAELECDDALDQRDSQDSFVSDWSDLYDSTRVRWSEASSEVRGQVDDIRKESFLLVSNATHQHEIASYVSDDFDLICRCEVLGIVHPIIEHLWRAYQSGTFPLPAGYTAQKSDET